MYYIRQTTELERGQTKSLKPLNNNSDSLLERFLPYSTDDFMTNPFSVPPHGIAYESGL